jgi:GTP-binding protein
VDKSGAQAANPFAGAHFILSAAQLPQLPQDEVPEVAFVGRSNSGKSSALNALCTQKQLARVSKTPGRTQLINLFGIAAHRREGPGIEPAATVGRLVDLPGYGFADVPLAIRRSWGDLVGGYVAQRPNLRGLIVLMDIRHPLTELDWQMLRWSRARNLPCHILLTKEDKLGNGAAQAALLDVRKQLRTVDAAVTAQRFSAQTRAGIDAAREVVAIWLALPGTAASSQAVEAPP